MMVAQPSRGAIAPVSPASGETQKEAQMPTASQVSPLAGETDLAKPSQERGRARKGAKPMLISSQPYLACFA